MKTVTKYPKKENQFSGHELKDVIKANELLHPEYKLSETDINEIIEIKNDRNKNVNSLRLLFLNVGMTLSLVMTIIIFNWKSYDRTFIELVSPEQDMEELIEIPISHQPPPPPPSKVPEVYVIKEVKDTEIIEELELKIDVEVTSDQKIEEIAYEATIEIEEEVVEEIFTIVEQAPEPFGGLAAFNKYLAENISYPKTATRLNVSGMVFVQFVVEKDGSLTDAKIVKGIGSGCDEEAIRVIENAPKWNPGKQRGQAVRVSKIIPIRFVLKK